MPMKQIGTFYIKFIYYTFKICGLATCSLNVEDLTFAHSKIGIFYNLILICLVALTTYVSTQFAYFNDFAGRIEFEKVTDTLQTIFVNFTAVFILITYSIRQTNTVELMNKLSSIEKTAIDLSIGADKSTGVRKIFACNVVTGILWIATLPMNSIEVLLYFIAVILANVIINCMLIQYSVILKLLKRAFRVANDNLLDLTGRSASTVDVKFLKLYADQTRFNRFAQLRQFHTNICQVCNDVSIFYSLPMIICTINIYLTLITYCYYFVKPIVIWTNSLTPVIIMHSLAQVVSTSVSMIILTRAASSTVAESKRTGEIVNECLTSLQNPNAMSQCTQFSNYLLHKNINFCVYNLFSLDEGLLMSITGSITTYLVILLQFKESSGSS